MKEEGDRDRSNTPRCTSLYHFGVSPYIMYGHLNGSGTLFCVGARASRTPLGWSEVALLQAWRQRKVSFRLASRAFASVTVHVRDIACQPLLLCMFPTKFCIFLKPALPGEGTRGIFVVYRKEHFQTCFSSPLLYHHSSHKVC